MALSGIRGATRLRVASVVLLALGPVGGLATPGWAAPTTTCFGEPATISGSGNLTGTSGDDVIVGSQIADTIDGLGGNDRICGLAGSDQLAGGLGNDLIDAGVGDDFVRGDVVNFGGTAIGGSHDILYLGAGNDNSLGDSVGSTASGGGNDYIDGGDGNDGLIGDSSRSSATPMAVAMTCSTEARDPTLCLATAKPSWAARSALATTGSAAGAPPMVWSVTIFPLARSRTPATT